MSPIEIVAEALHDQESDLSDCPYYRRGRGGPDDGVCDRGCHDEPQCVTCVPGEGGWPREELAERYASLLTGDEEPFGPSDHQVLDAAAAVEALHADGWRLVKTGEDGIRYGSKPHVAIFEEWTPEAEL